MLYIDHGYHFTDLILLKLFLFFAFLAVISTLNYDELWNIVSQMTLFLIL